MEQTTQVTSWGKRLSPGQAKNSKAPTCETTHYNRKKKGSHRRESDLQLDCEVWQINSQHHNEFPQNTDKNTYTTLFIHSYHWTILSDKQLLTLKWLLLSKKTIKHPEAKKKRITSTLKVNMPSLRHAYAHRSSNTPTGTDSRETGSTHTDVWHRYKTRAWHQ